MNAPFRLETGLAGARARLRRDGYCILRAAAPREEIEHLSQGLDERFALTPYCRGSFYGERTKRFHKLLTRAPGVAALVMHDLALGLADAALAPWCDCLQLNLTQAIEIHPGAPSQVPHRDQSMWRGAESETEYLVNIMWPLNPFRAENGATLVWPGSHLRQEEKALPPESAVAVEMDPGDALVFLGSTLHAGGANRTNCPRRGIIISYCLGWLKPFENMWLTYPPEVARHFDPGLAALVGYRQHRPNLGNVDGQCPSVLLGEGLPEFAGAVDALTPEIEAELAARACRQSNEQCVRVSQGGR